MSHDNKTGFSRRDFLKTTGLAALSAGVMSRTSWTSIQYDNAPSFCSSLLRHILTQ